jgi:RNA-directed DNA polymerase
VELAIRRGKRRVIAIDLKACFDNVRHHILLAKLAQKIEDGDVMHLLKLIDGRPVAPPLTWRRLGRRSAPA